MFDVDNWQEIWSTITRNKTRSFLTGFGVFWGLFMLILLMGVGSGFRNGIMASLDGFDVNTCTFMTRRTSEAYEGYRKGRTWSMNPQDIERIRRSAVSVEYVTPLLTRGTETVRGNRSGSFTNQGVTVDFFRINRMKVLQGRELNEIDEENHRKVCAIGSEVYETLFEKNEDPLGRYIRMDGIEFQVVGVIEPISSGVQIGPPARQTVYIPSTTMRQTFMRSEEFGYLICTARDGYPASVVEQEVGSMIRAAHDISPTDRSALESWNLEEDVKRIRMLFAGVDILVLIVGLSALLSGMIGITNIMLVTVRERRREIGVRRALGAKPWNILAQIMSESVVLTGIAGLLGFIAAVGILVVADQILAGRPDNGEMQPFGSPLISYHLALGAMAILIVAGAVAGLMPALKALQVKAIDALRDE